MKKELKKALLEIKEKKENLLIETNIAEKRIMMILESRYNLYNFKKIPFDKRLPMSYQLLKEFHYLQENTLLSEQFLETLKNLFGKSLFQNIFSGSIETIMEPILNSMLKKIGFKSEGPLKKFILSFLTTNPARIIKAFTDCKELTKLIAESIIEAAVMLFQDQTNTGSYAFDFARNTLGGMVKDISFIQKIEDSLGETVCNFFSSYEGKAKGVLEKLKNLQTG